jgi:hypothetical protein
MCRNRDPAVVARARDLYAAWKTPTCTCGFPYDDTPDHSPDCPVQIQWEGCLETAEREARASHQVEKA